MSHDITTKGDNSECLHHTTRVQRLHRGATVLQGAFRGNKARHDHGLNARKAIRIQVANITVIF